MSELSVQLQQRLEQGVRDVIHHDGAWRSNHRLVADVNTVLAALSDLGVREGHRVVLSAPNSYGFAAVYLGLLLTGATVVPLNPNMPAPEMQSVIQRSGAVGAIVHPSLTNSFAEMDTQDQFRFVAVLSPGATGDDPLVLRDVRGHLIHAPSEAKTRFEITRHPSDDAQAILLFTSGTTGTPKGVALTHRQVMATVKQVIQSHQLSEADIAYCFLPMFHINAQVIGMLSTLVSGGRMVIEPKFSASRFWNTVVEHRITWVSAVPTVIAILIKSQEPAPFTPWLRFVRSASAPLPALHAHRFEAKFGVPIIESYGLTEAASQVCVNPLPPGKRKIGSVGLPHGVDLRVVDDAGQELPAGEIGEIIIRGEAVITSYAYGDESGSSFRDGWFHTGDLGYVDAEGYVYITGRSKEMINRAGQKISPREVEEVLVRHEAVKSAAVIGLPDEVYGERVVAYLVLERPEMAMHDEGQALKAELKELCLSTISAYKCPAEFYFVDAVPAGPTGKIQRARLRQQVLAGQVSG
ncbi:MAG: AMP-binding protein [Alicyclobacillus sp.]|nr:AMP-binding protein [Alicyclobacillus sp.]